MVCVAQSDIQRFYDMLPTLLIAQWMISVGFNPSLVALAIRHQMFSKIIIICEGSAVFPHVNFRGVGGLTRSRVAGTLARIPILDLIHTHLRVVETWCPRLH